MKSKVSKSLNKLLSKKIFQKEIEDELLVAEKKLWYAIMEKLGINYKSGVGSVTHQMDLFPKKVSMKASRHIIWKLCWVWHIQCLGINTQSSVASHQSLRWTIFQRSRKTSGQMTGITKKNSELSSGRTDKTLSRLTFRSRQQFCNR